MGDLADLVVDFPRQPPWRRAWSRTERRLFFAWLAVIGAAFGLLPLIAGGGPIDGVQVVANATTAGNQSAPAVAALPGGRVVVVWSGAGPGDTDGVFARIRDPGSGFGPEILVNQTVDGDQRQPAVAADGAGNFLVAWTGPSTAKNADDTPVADRGLDVFTRLFDSTGAPQRDEERLNRDVAGDQSDPSVTATANRLFVVAFAGAGQEFPPQGQTVASDDQGIFVRVTGQTTPDVQVLMNRSATDGAQQHPAVAMNGSTLAAVWDGAGPGDDDGVFASLLSALPPGPVFRVNVTTPGPQRNPAVVARSGTNQFLAAWSGEGLEDDHGVFVAPLDGTTPAQLVNTTLPGDQHDPAMSVSGGGIVTVVWAGSGATDDSGIFARRWDLRVSVQPAKPVLAVNTTIEGTQDHPAVAGNAQGQYTVAFDGPGTSEEVFLRRFAVNDPPVVVDDAFTTFEDTNVAGDVLTNDSDADGDTLTVTQVGGGGPVHGSVTLDPDGKFTYVPDPNFNGQDQFFYQASDGTAPSAQNGQVTITVESVNDGGPTAVDDGPYQATEDAELEMNDLGRRLVANDTDPDGDRLTARLRGDPVSGTATVRSDGTFTYLPDPNFCGQDRFSYVASDGFVESSPAQVTVDVTCVVDAPEARDDRFSSAEDIDFTIPAPGVLQNDFHETDRPISAKLEEEPRFGKLVSFNADGSFTYRPAQDFNGTDTFTYSVVDDAEAAQQQQGPGPQPQPGGALAPVTGLVGGAQSPPPSSQSAQPGQVATVTIEIGVSQDAPLPGDDAYFTPEDTKLVVAAERGVLGNDTDPDQGVLTAKLATPPSRGKLETFNDDGSFTYVPFKDFNGDDLFTYEVTNQSGHKATGKVQILVGPQGDVVLATDDRYQVQEDQSLTVPAPGVLTNDVDPDSGQLAVSLARTTGHGTLELNRDGSFLYAPAPDFNGLDGFGYEIQDTDGNKATAEAVIVVTPSKEAATETTPTTLVGPAEPPPPPPPPVEIKPQTPLAPAVPEAPPPLVVPITAPPITPLAPPTVAVLPAKRDKGLDLPLVPLAAAGGGGLALAGVVAGVTARRRNVLGPLENAPLD